MFKIEAVTSVFLAETLQVGNNLSHLESVNVVRERHIRVGPVNVILDRTVEPGLKEDIIPDLVISLTVGAEQVDVNLNEDASLSLTLNPTGVVAVHGNTVTES